MILKTILASTLLVWSRGGPGAVQEVRIAQVGGETEIVVVTSGEVTYRDFALEEPPRLILDLTGAETGLPNSSYDAIRRGGVTRIRSSWRLNIGWRPLGIVAISWKERETQCVTNCRK